MDGEGGEGGEDELRSPLIVSFKTRMSDIPETKHIIKRLLEQTYIYKKQDKVILNIVSNEETNEAEEFLKSLSDHFPDTIIVNRITYDYGNVTNIVEALNYIETENSRMNNTTYSYDTRLIYCEDKVLYPKTMVEVLNLVSLMDSDNSIWGSTGFDISNMNVLIRKEHGAPVEVIEAFGGIIARIGTFLPEFKEYIESIKKDNIFIIMESSDIVISNYLSKYQHAKKIVNLENKMYSFHHIWSNINQYGENTILSRGMVWEKYMDAIYILSGWKELYLHMII